MKPLPLIFMILAVISVAVADVFLKKAAVNGNLWHAFKSPWMIIAVLLYLNQIIFFTYAFVHGWELSLIGSLQTALYAVIVLGTGIFFLKESLTAVQTIGIILAIGGAVLINS
jgi:multidrug transporter EmrE-like cation transporter